MLLSGKSSRLRVQCWVLPIGLLMATSPSLLAQQPGTLGYRSDTAPSLSPLQQNIVEFSARLSDGLGLSVRSGLFNTRAGDVKGTYLLHQGIVLELVTPLGATRPTLSLQSVNASLQQLSGQLAGLAESRRFTRSTASPTTDTTVASDSSTREDVAAFFREMNNRITSLAFYQDVDVALRNAAESARSLHASGQLNNTAFTQMNAELRQMQEDLAERFRDLSALQAELQRSSSQVGNTVSDASAAVREQGIPTQELRDQWQASLEQLAAGIEPLKQAAMAKAEQIQQQYQAAQEERNLQWQQELQAFEMRLFTLVCNDQQFLSVLPDEQHLTMIMSGLGIELNVGVRSSRIHVLAKEDIARCQSGAISPAQLTGLANTYSY